MTERPLTKNPWLRMSALPRATGVVMLAIGAVWTLQGLNIAQGSVMSGSTSWGVVGVVVFAAGAVVLWRALQRAKAEIANDPPTIPPADPPAHQPTELDGEK